ncbi:LysR family transcriptional regulator [Butyrivibrio sp. AC2005]|nr:LysR family transcriptional regulator [Butyrivibrio sp. AC2005]
MDIRIMQYFLAIIREGTISGAAEALHVAQPSLSRQMRALYEPRLPD